MFVIMKIDSMHQLITLKSDQFYQITHILSHHLMSYFIFNHLFICQFIINAYELVLFSSINVKVLALVKIIIFMLSYDLQFLVINFDYLY